MKVLHEQLKFCYHKAGVNHYVDCKELVEKIAAKRFVVYLSPFSPSQLHPTLPHPLLHFNVLALFVTLFPLIPLQSLPVLGHAQGTLPRVVAGRPQKTAAAPFHSALRWPSAAGRVRSELCTQHTRISRLACASPPTVWPVHESQADTSGLSDNAQLL
jgi:hypothetical protein